MVLTKSIVMGFCFLMVDPDPGRILRRALNFYVRELRDISCGRYNYYVEKGIENLGWP